MVLFRLFALMCRFGAVAGVFGLCVVLACWCLLSWFVVLVWLGGFFFFSPIFQTFWAGWFGLVSLLVCLWLFRVACVALAVLVVWFVMFVDAGCSCC